MPEVLLRGCSPEPLASYLKGLAVLRLVKEQVDPKSRGAWRPEGFVLASTLEEEELVQFFLERYVPTPILAPWNGGSGFFPKDNRKALDILVQTKSERFAPYRSAIARARDLLARLAFRDKPDKEAKETILLPTLRSEMDEAALHWLDAAIVLTGDGPKYPPLLGTGGNDGRLDFTNNQMQRLVEALLGESDSERRRSNLWLRAALFAIPVPELKSAAIGQFHPSAAGGANAGPAFTRDALTNAWDYILLMEGALLFASAATKRLGAGSASGMVFPFMVEAAGVGYASASLADEQASRNELWLPLWSSLSTLRELRLLLSEGRAKIGRRQARTGVDFARALGALGVDRGVDSFARFGFHARNGLAYFATPLGRIPVRRRMHVDLLAPLDHWLQQLRWKGLGDQAPASVRRGARALEATILDLSSGRAERPTEVLIALGEVERALSRSRKHEIAPVPALGPEWLERTDDHSFEFALARSLASTGIRERIARVRWSKPRQWLDQDDGRTVWGDGSLVENLIAVVEREEVERARDDEPVRRGQPHAVDLTALRAFLEEQTDDARLEQLLRGLAIVNFANVSPPLERSPEADDMPPTAFALLALARCREPRPGVALPRTAGLVARIARGDATGATALAARRLRGAGLVPRVEVVREPRSRALRIAAALAFPLGSRAMARLAKRTLKPRSATSQLEQE